MFTRALLPMLCLASFVHAATPLPASIDEVATLSADALAGLPDFKFPLGKPATDQQLEGKSLVELRLLRNSIYAQYGVAFKARWLRDYFEGRAWYGKGKKAEKVVAAVDLANAKLILAKEEALGGEAKKAPLGLDYIAVMSPEQLAALPDYKLPLGQKVDLAAMRARPLMELKLLRNSIFAQAGKADFNTPWLKAYFESRPWFKAKAKLGKVAAVDAANAEALKKLEDELAPKGDNAMLSVLSAGYCERKGSEGMLQRLVFQPQGALTAFDEEEGPYGRELTDSKGEWQLAEGALQIRTKSRWENTFSAWQKVTLDGANHRCN